MKKIIFYLGVVTTALILLSTVNDGHNFISKTYAKNLNNLMDSTSVDNGIGPIKHVKLGPINKEMAEDGQNLFNSKCIACHQLDNRLVGPPLRNITKQYSPVFIMNYLLNTTKMQQESPKIQELIKEYNGVIMPNQNLTKKETRELLEYLRSVASK